MASRAEWSVCSNRGSEPGDGSRFWVFPEGVEGGIGSESSNGWESGERCIIMRNPVMSDQVMLTDGTMIVKLVQ